MIPVKNKWTYRGLFLANTVLNLFYFCWNHIGRVDSCVRGRYTWKSIIQQNAETKTKRKKVVEWDINMVSKYHSQLRD